MTEACKPGSPRIGNIPGIGAEVWVKAADFIRAEAFLSQHRDRSEETAQPV
jgi:hypothetical protein